MKFLVSVLVSLLLSFPVAGQEVAQILLGLGCNTACVCHAEQGCPAKTCGTFNPTIPLNLPDVNWNRYGFDKRPLHIGDGTHSALQLQAENILLDEYGLTSLTQTDKWDINKVWCGNNSARSRLVSLSNPTIDPVIITDTCYPSWSCTEPPQDIVEACKTNARGYNCRGIKFRGSDRFGCWKLGVPTHLGVTVYFNESSDRCNPFLRDIEVHNPICGNSILEDGEDCETCPADQIEPCNPCP